MEKFKWRIRVKQHTPIRYILELSIDGKQWHEQGTAGSYRSCGELLAKIGTAAFKPVLELNK